MSAAPEPGPDPRIVRLHGMIMTALKEAVATKAVIAARAKLEEAGFCFDIGVKFTFYEPAKEHVPKRRGRLSKTFTKADRYFLQQIGVRTS